MRFLIALCALMACHCSEFIQTGEKEFVGEDTKLMKALHERMTHNGMKLQPMKLPRRFYKNKEISELSQNLRSANKNATRPKNPSRRVDIMPQDADETGDLNLRQRILDIMKHAIYLTQYRMKDLQIIMDKYSKKIEFRVAYIYAKLDTLIRNMRVLHTNTNATLKNAIEYNRRKIYKHLIYYSYFLKHNHDVTYIVEHFLELHNAHINKLKMIQAQKDLIEKKKQAHLTPPSTPDRFTTLSTTTTELNYAEVTPPN